MTRTGLIVALAIAVLGGLLFGLLPELDLAISAPFFQSTVPVGFWLSWHPTALFWRDAAMWVVAILVAPAAIVIVVKFVLPRRRMLIPGRAALFLLATLALGPGLVTNLMLKDHWLRSRPLDVPQFNGTERFTPWWNPRGGCAKNCSFVAGEGSGAFWTLAPAALAPPQWRVLAYAAAIGFGVVVSALRLGSGAHFASDILFAGVITFLVIWLVHGAIYRWPRTRSTDAEVERAIERIALPPHDFLRGLFAGRRG